MVLGQGYVPDGTRPFTMPWSAGSTASHQEGGLEASGRGDGFQSPQSRYFDPMVADPAPKMSLGPAASCPADSSRSLEAEMDRFAYSTAGSMGDMDQFGNGAGAMCEMNRFDNGGFAFMPPGATLVRLVPCVPVFFQGSPGPGQWARPYNTMEASPKAKMFNRGLKKGVSRDLQLPSEKGSWAAKAKSRPSSSVSAAVAGAFAAKGKAADKGPQWGSSSSDVKVSQKSAADSPSAVFVDLSCLRPQRRVLPRFAK